MSGRWKEEAKARERSAPKATRSTADRSESVIPANREGANGDHSGRQREGSQYVRGVLRIVMCNVHRLKSPADSSGRSTNRDDAFYILKKQ